MSRFQQELLAAAIIFAVIALPLGVALYGLVSDIAAGAYSF